jgi:peptide/nickel transport system permease protein
MKRENRAARAASPWQDVWFRLRRNKAAMFGLAVVILLMLMAAFADVIADYDTQVIATHPADRLQTPSLAHPFGTDAAGRDLLFRIVHGARYSLAFGIVCTLISLILGAALGAAAAFFGGKIDTAITFVIDAIMCIPGILLSLSLVAVLGAGFGNLMIAITVTSVPGFARIVRSAVLGVVRQEYVEAARAIGVPTARSIFAHVLPNAVGIIIVNATMQIAGLIMSAAGLSFIGMGVQPPAPEWGAMLNDSLTYLRTYPHIVIFPGLAIVLTSLSFNLLGDGLSEALDPRMKD